MSYLSAAIGAALAAILETSVFPEIRIAGTSPDLVFALMLASTMFLGAEEGLIWAFVGGLMLDLLASGDRPIGSATLTLLIVVGIAALIARVVQPPRIIVVVVTAFVLAFLYRAILLGVVAAATGVAVSTSTLGSIVLGAAMDAVVAGAAAWVIRALSLRFGSAVRTNW